MTFKNSNESKLTRVTAVKYDEKGDDMLSCEVSLCFWQLNSAVSLARLRWRWRGGEEERRGTT